MSIRASVSEWVQLMNHDTCDAKAGKFDKWNIGVLEKGSI
jgi:hypothetical protein